MKRQNQPGTHFYIYILFVYIATCFGSLAIIRDKTNVLGRYSTPSYKQRTIKTAETDE
jgi:hypothetical protein